MSNAKVSPQYIEMTPDQTRAFAAELRETANKLEAWAERVEAIENPGSNVYVKIAAVLPVRIRIGKEGGK